MSFRAFYGEARTLTKTRLWRQGMPCPYFLLPTSYFLLPTSYFLLPTYHLVADILELTHFKSSSLIHE